ncbi:pentatricopeptide repeat-containing protein At3g09040, mitochondrial-like [Selaginella moellendorffii]|uniref:pentatricopeptide repeat-containing protein At3g09040, mitochondrial-like n=1 Tax=Selaginella moellendorffii TaxID=88036 RepID=UPI000D1CE742|nr:pentatricopeptide repeat-containing protein At3g09040, mitochondrial-like [Selaginella moellendorffii]|eukprot:XP_024533803.1 pentatricopeptide repeat-containing protein At3g09040, mitochondrial-like [Selaginella moellendorffii]
MRWRCSSLEQSGIISALKVCVSYGDIWRGREIHWEVITNARHLLDIRVANTLISMYARCGSVADARAVFERLPCHHVVSWTNLILGYAGNGEEALALEIFRSMEKRGVHPEARTFVAALAACSGLAVKEEGILVGEKLVKLASLEQGMDLHSVACKRMFDEDIFVRNTLIGMYAKCGSLVDAKMVFSRMEAHSAVSWNALILGYLDNGEAGLALELFAQMKEEGCVPDARTFAAVLMACSSLGSEKNLEEVMSIHSLAASTAGGIDMYVDNALVGAYAKCGSMGNAREVFQRMPCHNVVSWTTMIQAEAESGSSEAALRTFEAMKIEGYAPNARTFLAVLMACAKLVATEEVIVIDEKPLKNKCLEKTKDVHFYAMESRCVDIFVANSLVDVYASCGSMGDARAVFERMPCHSVVSWNILIQGYAEAHGCEGEALLLFERVPSPDSRTFVAVLTACAAQAEKEVPEIEGEVIKPRSLKNGQEIHSRAAKLSMDTELHVENSLVDMYSRCGSMSDAWKVFELMSHRNVTSWTALIQGYVQANQARLALELFQEMTITCQPNSRTFLAALAACGELAWLPSARFIHAEICKRGLLDTDAPHFVEASLVDAYGKCGSMVDAEMVFDAMQTPTTVSWGALMAGFSRSCDHGKLRVFGLLERMEREGGAPNEVIFLAVLTACSHLGLIDRGRQCFEAMVAEHGIQAGIKHYQCVVDMLGRSNRVEEAVELLERMPVPPDGITGKTMLAAVSKWLDQSQEEEIYANANMN